MKAINTIATERELEKMIIGLENRLGKTKEPLIKMNWELIKELKLILVKYKKANANNSTSILFSNSNDKKR